LVFLFAAQSAARMFWLAIKTILDGHLADHDAGLQALSAVRGLAALIFTYLLLLGVLTTAAQGALGPIRRFVIGFTLVFL